MVELKTAAEELADKTRELSGFKKFSLPGVKEQVAAMLNLIGRDGIFSTYTAHDISHIESMLNMLDWLVPPQTKEAMTSADWLMAVLAIYFHDLGMVVTVDEFEHRNDNLSYCEFREALDKDPEARDYIARAEEMKDDERERFFFQEFIRENHARRVREWITGRGGANWGEHISPIADAVRDLLENLPPRFREHLGIVCESHHSEDLEDRQRYPLFERYGNLEQASVNVQYAAILLRTADLIHVTRDRTPSITYKVLRLSDPKSVDEWRKQRETFAVGTKTRKFESDNPDSHIIVVSADFTDESPFFSLTEYIAYADGQIKQSKRWADKSQFESDATDFSFPWHTFEGKILVEGNAPVRMKFELDRGRLLDLLVGHTIYNDPTVAVRELLQNAIDAVRYQHYLDSRQVSESEQPNLMGSVDVRWNPEIREFIVEDNGVGMDLDTINFHLMRVGSSFYDTDQFRAENSSFAAISRFGIGVLTCFMVSDDIEIVTRKSNRAYRIRMRSVHADYLLKELDAGDPVVDGLVSHGTRVTLKVRPSVDLKTRSLEEILRYWVILPECRVNYCEHGKSPKQIGFGTVVDAVRQLCNVPEEDDDRSRYVTHKVFSKQLCIDTPDSAAKQQYEVGFAVSQSYTPEWSFARPDAQWKLSEDQAAVCVEGIRVDNRMPGFQHGGILGLLSVRGNRDFRTTVSRTNLEQDAEYLRVGEMCMQLLFDHVKKEIDRIASKPGQPMSQASSAGRWLFHRIDSMLTDVTLKTKLAEYYDDVSAIVVEETGESDGEIHTKRSFVSRKCLAEKPHFWTIESRMVDSLGTISRDLGRELALNDFLHSLAPELCDTRISPVVVDAHQIRTPLGVTHHPKVVEFSQRHQQTAVHWEQGESWSFRQSSQIAALRKSRSESDWFEGLPEFLSRFAGGLIPPTRQDVDNVLNHFPARIEVAACSGDVDDINVVKTRVAILVDSKSKIGSVVKEMQKLFSDLMVDDGAVEYFGLLVVADALVKCLCTQPLEFVMTERMGDSAPSRRLWQTVFKGIESLWGHHMIEHIHREQDPTALAEQIKQFDVSVYWRDWAKGGQ